MKGVLHEYKLIAVVQCTVTKRPVFQWSLLVMQTKLPVEVQIFKWTFCQTKSRV